jgi:hypothetical protein
VRRFPDKVGVFLPIPDGHRQEWSETAGVRNLRGAFVFAIKCRRACPEPGKKLGAAAAGCAFWRRSAISSRERVRLKFVTRSPGVLASKSRAAIYCKSVAFGDGLELCGSGSIGYYGNQHPGLLSPGGHASLHGWDVGRRGGAGRGSAQPAGETFPLS